MQPQQDQCSNDVNQIETEHDSTSLKTEKKNRFELAREKLSVDEYLKLKAQGLTDRKIMKQKEISNFVFYKLKGEWGLTSSLQEPVNANTTNTNANSVEDTNADITEIDLNPADFNWIKRSKIAGNQKVLKVKPGRIYLSSAAIKALNSAEYVLIGEFNGILAIVPTDNAANGFKLSIKGQLGSRSIARYLIKLGFSPGLYELKEHKNGWLVTSQQYRISAAEGDEQHECPA